MKAVFFDLDGTLFYTLEDINVSFGSPGSPFSDNYLDILRKLIDDGKVPPYRM